MTVGIMQPYFFPYLGYWQLMNAVDRYVFLDDVNYVKKGWINRNLICGKNGIIRIGVPIHKVSQNKLINKLTLVSDPASMKKLRCTLEQTYRRAPYYTQTMALFDQAFSYESQNLADFLINSNRLVADYLQLKTQFYVSSALPKDPNLRAEERIIDICRLLDATCYINAIGGIDLYCQENFMANQMSLQFLQMKPTPYPQIRKGFVPKLSILDVMMFNSVDAIQDMLNNYTLVQK